MKKIIELIKIGDLDQSLLLRLNDDLKSTFSKFNISIKINRDGFQLEEAEYNSERSQYNADKILNRIIKLTKNYKVFRIMGVMDKDIFSKDYKFNFGIAQISRRVGLISITRLRESFYEEQGFIHKKGDSLRKVELRTLKEAVHELGHTFGLEHCHNYCIMRFSESLMDTDKKPAQFCESCLIKIKEIL
jgi:archaemetzincin